MTFILDFVCLGIYIRISFYSVFSHLLLKIPSDGFRGIRTFSPFMWFREKLHYIPFRYTHTHTQYVFQYIFEKKLLLEVFSPEWIYLGYAALADINVYIVEL